MRPHDAGFPSRLEGSALRPIVIVGAGGFGRETVGVLAAMNEVEQRWDLVGVVDDAPAPQQLERLAARGVAWLGTIENFAIHGSVDYVVAIGDPRARERIAVRMDAMGHTAAVVVHPLAGVGPGARISGGSIVCAGAQLSTNVELGRHVHINPNATIGHDAILNDYVSVNPAAVVSGEVIVARGVLLGAASVVLQGLTVGEGALVGASACVTRDVAEFATVKGVPARGPIADVNSG